MWVHGWRKAGSGGQINENSKCITLGDFFLSFLNLSISKQSQG